MFWKSRGLNLFVYLMVVSIFIVGCGNSGEEGTASSSENSKSDQTESEAVTNEDGDQEQYEIKLGTVFGDAEPVNEYAREAAERINEKTDGAVTIEVYPDSTLGSNVDTFEQIQSGAAVIGHGDPGYYQEWVPDIGVLQGPYLVDEPEEYNKLLESEWYEDVSGQMADEGLTVLAFNWILGDRHMISDKEIRSPEDLSGSSVRISPNTMWRETISAMGGTPDELEWSEVYTALSSGVVDAAEAPLETIYTSSLHESADTLSLTGHFKAISGFVIGTDYFESMPEEYQDIIMEEFKKSGEDVTESIYSEEDEWIKTFESEGVNVVDDVDTEAFKEATKDVYNQFDEWSPGLYEEVQDILEE
ncbi:C4-dicarboxylate TRAP transporter substrate-binding protein [Salibacterium aidingense]|uniref:C4-dicarboxylate TRAP transporter substrate-binding protein n=1 Tax=Salibacterium aidingense TaxID=384933 RepID=UPI003BCFB097